MLKILPTILALVIMSACVPIPETPPVIPAAEAKVDFSVLSSALAKDSLIDNTDEFQNRVTELGECALHVLTPNIRFTPEEAEALAFYFAGSIQTAALVNRAMDVEEGRLDEFYDSEDERTEGEMLQQLDWAIAYCRDD